MLLLGFFLVFFSGVCHGQYYKRAAEETSPFDANKNGVLDWISQIFQQYGLVTDSSAYPEPPEAIDQSKCEPCACGLVNQNIRIVGGEETLVNEYSWMALLTYKGVFYCGGTLLNSRYVLTASHCVHSFSKEKIRVRLLEHDQSLDNETTTIERGVSLIYEHRNYSPDTIDNDIAIIKLDEEVELTEEFMPACLPPPKKSFSGEIGIVTGWGVSKVRRGTSPTLQELEVPIFSNEECRSMGYKKSQITDNMLCAGYKDGGKDSCQGDSGGPLHIKEQDFHHIIGVVSWGKGCAMPNYPGVYTRVNRYLPWILKNTADACQCKAISRKNLSYITKR